MDRISDLLGLIILILSAFTISFLISHITDYLCRLYEKCLCTICVNNATGLILICLTLIFKFEYLYNSIILWLSLIAGNSIITEIKYGITFEDKLSKFKNIIKHFFGC